MKTLKTDYIISDRYFFDSVVNILFLDNKRDPSTSLGMTFIAKVIPKPDLAFYINVNPEIIMQRERKPDQGVEYLLAKEKIYKSKLRGWNIAVINGEKSKEEIFNEIKSQIPNPNVK